MVDKLLSGAGYLVSGLLALVMAVYMASFWLKSAESAVPDRIIAQVPPPAAPGSAPVEVERTQPVSNEIQQATEAVDESFDAGTAFLEPYLYDTREGRRNPFKPTPLISPGSYSNQILGPATPLERYEVDELKLVGILWDVKNPRAMFLDPNNEVHQVTKDDRIGRRRGYVAVIREGEVVVVETTTFGGENVYSTRVLRIDR